MKKEEKYYELLQSKNKEEHLQALELIQYKNSWTLEEALDRALMYYIQNLSYKDIKKARSGDYKEAVSLYFGKLKIQIQIYYHQYSTISWTPANSYIITKVGGKKQLFKLDGESYNSGDAYCTIDLRHFKSALKREYKALITPLVELIDEFY